jgi:hypothetical protein
MKKIRKINTWSPPLYQSESCSWTRSYYKSYLLLPFSTHMIAWSKLRNRNWSQSGTISSSCSWMRLT